MRFVLSTSLLNSVVNLSGSIGLPKALVNTLFVSFQAGPANSRVSDCVERCFRSVSTAALAKAVFLNDLFVLGVPSVNPSPTMRCKFLRMVNVLPSKSSFGEVGRPSNHSLLSSCCVL